MRNVTFAYLGPDEAAAKYGKKGTASDVTLWNAKKGDAHLNLVTPSRYPEKLPSLLMSLDLADEVVLHPQQLDRTFGETVVGCELFGRTRGFVRPGPNQAADQLRQLLAKTALKDLDVSEEPEAVFRERLYEHAGGSGEGPLVVPVDHAFPVKGVGTVILGMVRTGRLEVHHALQAYPREKTIDIRSIQVHDVDQKAAPARSRVGLAVKGAEPDEVGRGTVLAPPGSLQTIAAGTPTALRVDVSPFAKTQPRPGITLHLYHVLQDIVLRIETVEAASKTQLSMTVRPESPMAVVPGQPMVVVDLDNKVQRFLGRAALPA